MTEDQAKKTWCPNMSRADTCIASACMAWRVQHKTLTGWAIHADDQEPIYSAAPPGSGFCGLAGAPQ